MSANDPFPLVAADQPKPSKKPHWREKLFSKDKSQIKVTSDKQIEDFLATSRPLPDQHVKGIVSNQNHHHNHQLSQSHDQPHRQQYQPPQPPPLSTHRALAPHHLPNVALPQIPYQISPSSDKHAAFTVQFTEDELTSPEQPQPQPQSHPIPQVQQEQPQRSKTIRNPRKGKGLRVGFSERAPDVMGEGGDETDTPTIEISRALQRSREMKTSQPPRSPDPSRPHLPTLRVNTSLGDGTQRAQASGGGTSPNHNKRIPLMLNVQDAEFLTTLKSPGSRISFRGSPDSHSFAERVRNQMQAEEGRALHHTYEEYTSPVDDDDDDDDNDDDEEYEDDEISSPDLPSHSPKTPNELCYNVPPISVTSNGPSVKSIVHSIRNPPSPTVHRGPDSLSPIDPRIPPNLVPGSPGKPTPPQLAPPSPVYVQAPPYEEEKQSAPLRQASPPKQKSLPSSQSSQLPSSDSRTSKFTLRSVANQVGDVAFTEFREYIAQHDGHLRSAAESVKPLMETSLTEWVRAAMWWFLRGKTRLEAFARSKSAPPSAAKQAVIDLGKAFWICENIVPVHNELSRIGNGRMSIDACLAVASTTGDKEMADLLSLHLNIQNHLRSLSMSIKRNNILATIFKDDRSPSHLDTSVWLRYPFFAPDVSAVLSGAATRSMLADKPGKTPSIVYMMPLGDTSRYFSYGSMFVQACVSSRDDQEGQQYAMPCCLTIIRERTDWYVFAAITSQSQLVNVMIQSDRKQGPTWDDVDWQVRSNSMRVKLPRGFELDVMFKDEDFKMLWNIVKYTQKSESTLAPEAGETVVFENTLKLFQYMDPSTPKAFPSDPLERCRVRLFERLTTVTEGTGSRSAHRGFRLTVLTSPKVKTLSCVKHVLGQGSPLVFGLLRGEDGAPALLLKVTEEGRTRSMLLTFHEVEERTRVHALLLGMMAQEDETKTPDIPIRGYAIEEPADAASGRPAITHLQFPAGNVSVIDQPHANVEHGYGPTILSEHLRAFVATEWGSVTDRINLGPGYFKIGLDVNRRTGMSLFRPPQQDLTISLADNLTRPEQSEQVADLLQRLTTKPMIRRFDFGSLQGMLSQLAPRLVSSLITL
ncbi:hypothetical protein N7495_007327 [Penicillium taxi]|uniref:uncharacterized protein n=1 Tax=Penicillium taxi TaxID=168475 RepID=UPI002544D948|nr:uncharacterized protein N7495_007327 [Penicillium taxi]KAJ5895636.1 hypothetical protein N7495_007327 [Penicillium taxi]